MAENKMQVSPQDFGAAARTAMTTTYAPTGAGNMMPNRAYNTSPFDPMSNLAMVSADPAVAETMPNTRYIDPRVPSQLNSARAEDIQAYLKDPKKWLDEHAPELNQEQSLIDKGKSMLAHVFDYRDEADLSLFGINLSGVESVFDGFMAHYVGAYDLLSIGFGGLLSAAPGGLRTLSYDELSGGKSVGQVLNGEMEPGSAPSPGQIFVAGMAQDAKKIRDGQARLSDMMTVSPLAVFGLLAPDSPLQQDGFDITNKEQRDKAFGSGWEQWMSGVTDAGLMFADPLIGVGVGAKVLRVGMLGSRGSLKYGIHIGSAIDNSVDEITSHLGDIRPTAQILSDAETTATMRAAGQTTTNGTLDAVKAGEVIPELSYNIPKVKASDPIPKFKNPMSEVIWRLSAYNDDGTKAMKAMDIQNMPEIAASDMTSDLADMLERASNPLMVGLVLQAASGTPDAMKRLAKLAPALADQSYRMERARVSYLAAHEPAKLQEINGMFDQMITNLDSQLTMLNKQLDDIVPGASRDTSLATSNAAHGIRAMDIATRRDTIVRSIEEATELKRISASGEPWDALDPTSAFHNAEQADAIINDIHAQQDVIQAAINKDIYNATVEARFYFPSNNTAYSRAVTQSRLRRGTAKSQYAREGTSILPKKRVVGTEIDPNTGALRPIIERSGWFAESQFDGVSRFRRAARIWRWAGTETPSGLIGLRGTSTVGSEREFTAALDLDMYRGEAKTFTVPIRDEHGVILTDNVDGKVVPRTQEVTVGGQARRDSLYSRFYQAMNNPNGDPLKALNEVESAVMEDFALIYGLDARKMDSILEIANKHRAANLELIKSRGYFVDSASGEIQHAPYLQTHLANKTYMQNFQELEKILRNDVLESNGARIRAALDTPIHLAGSAYEIFNRFWRPATLLRLSYTQRNVFEGLGRAMAFTGSLAPLTWPVKGTYMGVRNIGVKRAATRQIKKAQTAIDSSEFGQYYQRLNDATLEHYRLQTAAVVADGKKKVYYVFDKVIDQQGTYKVLSQKEYDAATEAASVRLREADEALKLNASKFDDSVRGTKFGSWREKQITAVEQRLAEHQAFLRGVEEMVSEVNESGMAFDPWSDPAFVDKWATSAALVAVDADKLNWLKYDPIRALGEYRGVAGRQKRIGSGTSIGPDGNQYEDAFRGPLSQINENLMSADNTIKQSLSLKGNILSNVFQKILVRENKAIPFNSVKPDEWIRGMASVIEEASSNRLIQRLVASDWDIEDSVKWLTSDPEGMRYMASIIGMSGNDIHDVVNLGKVPLSRHYVEPELYVMDPSGSKRLGNVGYQMRTADGSVIQAADPRLVDAYVVDVAHKAQSQMQNAAFLSLLKRRISEKVDLSRSGVSGKTGAAAISPDDVKTVLNSMSDVEKSSLGFVQGAEIIQQGTNQFMDIYTNIANKLFHMLGTIPEDSLVRGPFYNTRYKATRNQLIREYWNAKGIPISDVRTKVKSASGNVDPMSIAHPEFKIASKDLHAIEVRAHRRALKDTREWMYTIERRTKLGKYGEAIYPFISAQQNSVTVIGKLLVKEPWLAPAIIDLWRMPNRLGVEDENGNISMPVPFGPLAKYLEDHPDIPVIGGIVNPDGEITIPKNGLNPWLPDNGYGPIPTPTPIIQIGAGELMKKGMFPVEMPDSFKAVVSPVLGEDGAAELYKSMQDYLLGGPDVGLSDKLMSIDRVLPPWLQKVGASRNKLDKRYGMLHTIQLNEQMLRYKAGERDTPPNYDDPNEIDKRVTNLLWFEGFGNFGVPTPLTPYPILTRPQVSSTAVTALQEALRAYQAADFKTDPEKKNDPTYMAPLEKMNRQFGDWALPVALTKTTVNVAGADPTAAAMADAKTFGNLIEKVAPVVGDNLDVIGIIVNNRSDGMYDENPYRLSKTLTIPGTNHQFTEQAAPEQAEAERQRIAGWTVFRQAMDVLDTQLYSAGLKNYESAAAAPYKAAKNQLIWNLSNNPEYAGWLADYQDFGGNRTNAAITAITYAINDPTFQQEMYKSNKTSLLQCMQEYIYYRDMTMQAVRQSGKSLSDTDNAILKLSWETIKTDLRSKDARWAEISNYYLASDDDPTQPGIYYDINAGMTPEQVGAING